MFCQLESEKGFPTSVVFGKHCALGPSIYIFFQKQKVITVKKKRLQSINKGRTLKARCNYPITIYFILFRHLGRVEKEKT